MGKLKCKVMFDNGGSVSVDFNGFKHLYMYPEDAARDYLDYVQIGNTDGWEGHEEECQVYSGKCPNGGYVTYSHAEIQEILADEEYEYDGSNDEEFFEYIKEAQKANKEEIL